MNIETIKRRMLVKYPTFGSVVAKLKYLENKQIPTAATDGEIVYYNQDFLNTLNEDEQIFLFAHEVCHVAFNHILRREGKDKKLWNKATDAVINALLKEDGLEMVPGGVDIPEAIQYDAEQMYEKLLAEKQQSGNKGKGSDSSQNGEGDNSENQDGNGNDDNSENQNQSQNGNGSENKDENQNGNGAKEQQGNGKEGNSENQSESSKGENSESKEEGTNGNGSGNQQENENQNGEESSSNGNMGQSNGDNSQETSEDANHDVGHDSHSLWDEAIKKAKEKESKSNSKPDTKEQSNENKDKEEDKKEQSNENKDKEKKDKKEKSHNNADKEQEDGKEDSKDSQVKKSEQTKKQEDKKKQTAMKIAKSVAENSLQRYPNISSFQNRESWRNGYIQAMYDIQHNNIRYLYNKTIQDLKNEYKRNCEEGHYIQAEKILEEIGYFEHLEHNCTILKKEGRKPIEFVKNTHISNEHFKKGF